MTTYKRGTGNLLWIVIVSSTAWVALSCPIASRAARADALALAGKVVSVDGRVLIRQDGEGSGAAAPANPAKPGDQVKEGDVINTSSNGKIKLLMADQTILDLGASSLFKVEKFQVKNIGDRQVDMQMSYGSVRASVSKAINPAAGGKFQIRTRTATMGVRGTEFIVQSEIGAISKKEEAEVAKQQATDKKDGKVAANKPQETKITVVQGKVEVAVAAKPAAPAVNGRKVASEPKAVPVMLTAGTQLTASLNAPATKPITLTSTEMTSVTASAKISDNTFQKAVNMDLSSGGSGGSQSGSGSGSSTGGGGSVSGAATLAAITSAVEVSVNTLSAAPILPPAAIPVSVVRPVFVPPGTSVNVHIVVSH